MKFSGGDPPIHIHSGHIGGGSVSHGKSLLKGWYLRSLFCDNKE